MTGDRLGAGSQLFGVGPTCEVAGLDCESTQVGYPVRQGNHVVTGGVDVLRGGCGGWGVLDLQGYHTAQAPRSHM